MTIAELLSAWRANNDALTSAVDTYAAQLGDLGARLAQQIAVMPRLSDGRLAAEANLERIHAMLEGAGWGDMLAPLRSLYGDVANGQQGILEILGSAGKPSELAINRAMSFSLGQFGKIHADLSANLLSQLQVATTAPIPQRTMAAMVRDLTGSTKAQAKTIVSTASAGLQREVAGAAMDDLPDGKKYYLYLGPSDGSTRKFCRRYAGKAIPESQINKLRNGTGLPVLRYAGGYNCRHSLIPISERIRKLRGIEVAS